MSTMTPATAALKKAGISYKLYEYDADGQHHDFGHHAADESTASSTSSVPPRLQASRTPR